MESKSPDVDPSTSVSEVAPEQLWMSYDPELDVWFQSSAPPNCYMDEGVTEPPTLYIRAAQLPVGEQTQDKDSGEHQDSNDEEKNSSGPGTESEIIRELNAALPSPESK